MIPVPYCRLPFRVACVMILTAGFCEGFSQTYDSLPNQPDYYVKQTAAFRAEKLRKGCTIFLGNSITEGGDWKILLKDTSVVNRGISGDVTSGVLRRLDEVTRHQPKKLFLLIGVNDLSRNVPNAVIIQNIFSIIGRIHSESPGTRIYVQSLFPVNPQHKNFPPLFNKGNDILEVNGQLKKYQEPLQYTYLDVYNYFLDDRFFLDARYTTDGLHLNQAGYGRWVEYLKKEKCL